MFIPATKSVQLHGHRGARGILPENSIPSFLKALELGVDALELDVGVSADHVIIVHHDEHLNPATTQDINGNWLTHPTPALRQLSVDELKMFDIGQLNKRSAYGQRYKNQQALKPLRIPTLSEMVNAVKAVEFALDSSQQVMFNIEVKSTPTMPDVLLPPEEFADLLVATVTELDIAQRCIVQCFDWRCLQRVQKIAPTIPTGYLTTQQAFEDNLSENAPHANEWRAGYSVAAHDYSVPKTVKAAGGTFWCPYYRELSKELLDEAHELELEVLCWTVNNETSMRKLAQWGVNGLISDYPDKLRLVLGELGMTLPNPIVI